MRQLFLWGPALAHMALIFAASSTSDPTPLPSRLSDKVVHLGAYALLGLLLLRAIAGGRAQGWTWTAAAAAVLAATLYGVTDEWHQSFVPGRTADPMDLVADFAGAAAGALGGVLAARWWSARYPRVSSVR